MSWVSWMQGGVGKVPEETEAGRKWVAEVGRNRQRSDMGYRLWSEAEMDQEKANPS